MAKSKAARNNWFAIRATYLFGKKRDGSNIFEERIVVFSARTVEKAFVKAEKEAAKYAKFHNIKLHPLLEAYGRMATP